METIFVGSDKVKKLSKEDIALYFEKAFANPRVQHMITSADKLSSAESKFQHFGNMLQAYVSATGDISEKVVEAIAADFEQHSDKLAQPVNRNKIDGVQRFFADHVLPHIIKHHIPDNDAKSSLSLQETVNLLKKIKLNCRNNRFKTHSFNGVLLNEIKTNGLDIHKEMFQKEYAILRKVGMFQPYQTGNLLFCELSKATFGYALCSPERLVRSICPMEAQKDDQPTREYLSEGLKQALSEKNLSPETQKLAMLSGQKMIDFYFGNSPKSAIAFMSDTNGINSNPLNYKSELDYLFMDYLFKSRIEKFCQSHANPQLYEQFVDALADVKQQENFEKMDKCINKFNKLYPDNNLFEQPIQNAVIKAVTKDCLNNFMHNGNADGYSIDGGRLETDKFSVATLPNPVEMFTMQRKRESLAAKEKFMAEEYNRELYESKYAFTIKSGRTPNESFEEYCAKNEANLYLLSGKGENAVKFENPQYTHWKKERGYDNPKSEASIELEKKIARSKGWKIQQPTFSIDSFQLL